jgi:ATP-dependent DNA helicase PIF1
LYFFLTFTGEMLEFKSQDDGDTRQLRTCEAPSMLYLKLNAKVVLTVNLTDSLVNGSRGIVKGFTKESVTVLFDSVAARVQLKNTCLVYTIGTLDVMLLADCRYH